MRPVLLCLLAVTQLAGCASRPPVGAEGGLLEANKLPAGESVRPKCRTGETLVCRNVEQLSDGRMPVDEEDLGSCRCRPARDIGRVW